MYKLKILLVTVLVVIYSSLGLAGCGGEQKESGGDGQAVNAEHEATRGTGKESAVNLLAKGQQIEGMSCDYVITAGDMTMEGKMWVQGEKVKHETKAEGQNIIMIFDGSAFYTYTPAENMAIKYTNEDMQGDSGEVESPLDYTEDVNEELITELETENYEGVKCRVLLIKAKDSQDEVKMWVREDYGLPVRVEATDTDGNIYVSEFKNIKVGALPANTFELPADVQVQDISEIMG
ncbi:LolA family protein [Desulfoscipio gibsoniae]|uniref:Outer membrane lipoprotein-sorting protein n=1 Tax=Desulfoscipio gibsoniae DSM 7213 TaxID=767817 RepID=R4KFL9_9FIRM|nr:outer membrane lipoprotein carrier protein LolA [Desulfoscipio gibsoniae]AGL00457.1 outer membrane lipoprotein-sorting protein [Desulfoscipio gibsoniae DSM 7213]